MAMIQYPHPACLFHHAWIKRFLAIIDPNRRIMIWKRFPKLVCSIVWSRFLSFSSQTILFEWFVVLRWLKSEELSDKQAHIVIIASENMLNLFSLDLEAELRHFSQLIDRLNAKLLAHRCDRWKCLIALVRLLGACVTKIVSTCNPVFKRHLSNLVIFSAKKCPKFDYFLFSNISICCFF